MSENFGDKKDAIKALLNDGDIVVTKRGAGKTLAMVEMFAEDDRVTYVAHNSGALEHFVKMFKDKYPNRILDPSRVILGTTNPERLLGRQPLNPREYRILVDEFFLNPYNGPYYAAAGSVQKTVIVL